MNRRHLLLTLAMAAGGCASAPLDTGQTAGDDRILEDYRLGAGADG
jgi:hypothetical protein